jgi:hypothetical protein
MLVHAPASIQNKGIRLKADPSQADRLSENDGASADNADEAHAAPKKRRRSAQWKPETEMTITLGEWKKYRER